MTHSVHVRCSGCHAVIVDSLAIPERCRYCGCDTKRAADGRAARLRTVYAMILAVAAAVAYYLGGSNARL